MVVRRLRKMDVRGLWSRLRCERGVAATEFALVLPVLVLLVFGIVDVGRLINRDVDQTHLANEGARLAAVNDANAASLSSLASYLKGQQDAGAPTSTRVCVDFPSGTATVGSPIKITVRSTFDFIPFVYKSATDGPHHVLTSTATMRLEQQPTASLVASKGSCV